MWPQSYQNPNMTHETETKKRKKNTRSSAVLENGLNHRSDFIFPNRPQTFQSLGSKKLQITNLPHLHIMRPIIGPNQITPSSTKNISSFVPVPIRQLLIILLQHFLSQLTRCHNNVKPRVEAQTKDGAVDFGKISKAAELEWRDVVEIPDDGEGARAGREIESQPLIYGVESCENEEGGCSEQEESHGEKW